MTSRDEAFFDVVSGVDSIGSAQEIPSVLDNIKNSYDLQSVAYFALGVPGRRRHDPLLAVTYSPDWVDHYVKSGYVGIDPVLKHGFSSALPIEWHAREDRDSALKRFFGEAVEFGVGRRGLTFPVRGYRGERALLTITSNAAGRDWPHGRRIYQRDFLGIASHFHEMMLRIRTAEAGAESVKLSPREIECLDWAARGKTTAEIAVILSLSERTVRFYHELARTKLQAQNITHAVSKAMSLNLISLEPPLSNPPY